MRAILTWHSIDPSGSPISVSPDLFRRQVAWLASGRARVVEVSELLRLPHDEDAVALTFDDGFANFATEAAPLLLEHGLPVTVFVVSGQVGRDNVWPGSDDPVPQLPLMDWDTLGRLGAQGVTYGAHTRTHPKLPTLGAAALEDELGGAAEEIAQRLGARPAGFAYPYGATDAPVTAAVSAQYHWACTTEFRSLSPEDAAHALPRLDAWYLRADHLMEAWGTAGFRAWVWARRHGRSARATLERLGGRR